MAPDVQTDSSDARQILPKKKPKWSSEEDVRIIELRGRGMTWEDISEKLPGRSAMSCRLHYQNYLERRGEWSEDLKTKLALLYERFKSEMWAKIEEEMAMPWRAAEAMHWQLGEQEMARRAGTVPFSFSQPTSEPLQASRTVSVRLPSIAEFEAGVLAYRSDPPNSTELNCSHAAIPLGVRYRSARFPGYVDGLYLFLGPPLWETGFLLADATETTVARVEKEANIGPWGRTGSFMEDRGA
ncbi:hypothetical protein I7I51_05606 [Histoplasma capsulatum]|uniref:MYB DNA-binding domain-containing protein n=1 Tax=Ajellomyces capsulatus TaxID=5037 RepID=A0A8A1M7V0_AJECA|nr:predicted protein [Histoplasma mississippiense (nom. inval.)]EDN06863.1 predicted protein [Histoplasma mississippiense (nom. inval.)]QSS60803.1 hypothetical protein I7I51_05606 [Histoplasma capsulatum]